MSKELSRSGKSTKPAGGSRKIIMYATIAVLVLGVVVAVALASRVPKAAQTVNGHAAISIGGTAPTFAAATTNGPFDLATATGPVFLEVFATWCPHCQREVSVIHPLFAKYGSKVQFVAVSGSPYGLDGSSPENQADVLQFVQKLGVQYPVAFDPDLKVANAYLQGGYPTIVMIDAQKKIRFLRDGEVSPADLEAGIQALLAQK
jgi:thiol-disulfide isomerase/thioredoxin